MSQQDIDPNRMTDLIVIGGGIYGVMLALEAGRRGRTVRVVEKSRLGGATTANWFRILHGGFRYLQNLDLVRTRESAIERRWFLDFAPDLVRPFPFIMPLYGDGLKHPLALRAAFFIEGVVTAGRNRDLAPENRIAPGRLLSPGATAKRYRNVRRDGLLGAALWQDAVAFDDAALLARLRSAAERAGAIFEEETEALALSTEVGRVTGIEVSGGRPGRRRADAVINAAGPWSAEIAGRFRAPSPQLFHPTLAFNLLLDRPPLAETGLAVAGPGPRAPMLFLMPFDGQTFAGTWHARWQGPGQDARVEETEIEAFLAALAEAAPSLGAKRSDVVAMFPGLQPLARPGTTKVSNRPVFIDHSQRGGPDGFFSVSGVKYTTARKVAGRALDRVEKRLMRQQS